ncbi:hypothetical protein [Pantoea dispersa]|uniref:hypothetical protein n=1 Tax=Pantoea dispersa TaxID=59814 RepID=UPI000FDB7A93|nr:hypothetical protein [Pantoea dispersa]RVU75440.1 hypothetical protein EKH82_13290 [Pantoea dispersa]
MATFQNQMWTVNDVQLPVRINAHPTKTCCDPVGAPFMATFQNQMWTVTDVQLPVRIKCAPYKNLL